MASTGEVVGIVGALWRYPVKSMQGEELNAAEVTARGLLGDRAFALIDSADGKVVSAKNPRKWPNLFDYRANYYLAPRGDTALPPIWVTFPDGNRVSSNQSNVNHVLSRALGRDVTLQSRSDPGREGLWLFSIRPRSTSSLRRPSTDSASCTPRAGSKRGGFGRTWSLPLRAAPVLSKTRGSAARSPSAIRCGCGSPARARAAS